MVTLGKCTQSLRSLLIQNELYNMIIDYLDIIY
jgi:hypothetical protein